MKKFYTLLCTVLFTVVLVAQSPEKMSYQAVIRNSSNVLVASTTIGMRISILQGSESGTAAYVETQTPTTNINGLVTINIGEGTASYGTFASIIWANGPYYIKTEIATAAPLTTYTITGTSQLLSVPYALLAKTVTSYPEVDPVFVAWNKSAGISITASQVTDFQTSVTNNAAVLLNTAKNSYPTADATKLAAITGTNTGDETAATIKTKLGITTLSGSNTGDQTLLGLGGVESNAPITGATNTKITYDAKGLVTAGTVATTADITASADKNYVTNAQLTVIGNTSGTNSGDNAVNTLYSGLVTNASHTGDAIGSTALTVTRINGTSLAGLATGILKNTTGTGVPSIALAADFPILNQSTTGNAATVTTNANLTGDVTSTGNATTILNKKTVTATLPVVITGSPTVIAGSAVAISINPATTSDAGSMSAADKTKLNNMSHYLGQSLDGGIVFYIYKKSDGTEGGLIVSTSESSAVWEVALGGLVLAGSTWDGATNTNSMPTTATTARAYVNLLGLGWYVPSIDELNLLWQNRFHVNKALAGGGTLLLYGDYWSSTEIDALNATSLLFKEGKAYQGAKTGTGLVRAIRSF